MATTKPVTADDLIGVADGYRYDLIRGELYRMSAAGGGDHGDLAAVFSWHLGSAVYSSRRGKMYIADTGFILRRDPDTLVAPDVAFVRSERVPAGRDHRGFLDIVPDIALEVVSPSDSARLVREKIQAYRDAGIPLLIVLYPDHRSLTVYRHGQEPEILGEDDILDGGEILAAFRLPVKVLFRG